MARLERRPAERLATIGAIVQLLFGAIAVALWWMAEPGQKSATLWVFWTQALMGVLVWIVTAVHLRQSRLAEEEQEEWERLQKEREAGGARGSMFEQDEILAFSARNRLRIFEKYIAPIMSLVLSLLMGVVILVGGLTGVISQARILAATQEAGSPLVLLSVFVIGGICFIMFLIATYASGMSKEAEWRPLRASGSYMMFSALFGLIVTISLALGYYGHPLPDKVLGYLMLVALGVIALEILLNFVLDFYRPRVEGVETRSAYDSRLLGLLAQPGGIFKTVSATLDYQFGFRVSQTWFYRFIEQAIAPLILFQILTLYLLTCVVVVGPEQKGVVERFGRYREVGGLVGPGAHLKWPWPFERVYRFPANEVKVIHLGHAGKVTEGDKILWTNAHYEEEFNVMVAEAKSDAVPEQLTPDAGAKRAHVPSVNLIVATTTIRYKIRDVYNWYYKCIKPDQLLEAICEREQIQYLASANIIDIMGPGRAKLADDLAARMQAAADKAQLGVEILGVGVEGIHPPTGEDVPRAFHEWVDAVAEREVKVLTAQKDAIETIGKANADAAKIKLEARGDFATRVNQARAETERFTMQRAAYANSPEVFIARERCAALEEGLANTRKFIVGVRGLETEKVRIDLADVVGPELSSIGEFTSTQKPEKK